MLRKQRRQILSEDKEVRVSLQISHHLLLFAKSRRDQIS